MDVHSDIPHRDIVAIGASSGGIEEVGALLAALRTNRPVFDLAQSEQMRGIENHR
jgi:hypothetical protein